MARKPSPETTIRYLKRDLAETERRLIAANEKASEYRARATKAETECAEWKRRFDALLKLTAPEGGDG